MSQLSAELPLALPDGGDCAPCVERARSQLERLPGVERVDVDTSRGRVAISYDPDRLALGHLETVVAEVRSDLARIGHETLPLVGLDCADCAVTLEKGVARLGGVLDVSASFTGSRMRVEFETGRVGREQIVGRVRELGYDVAAPAAPTAATTPERAFFWRRNAALLPPAAAAAFWAVAFVGSLLGAPEPIADALYAAAIVVGGYRVARGGYFALVRGRTIGIDALMTIAVVGAALIGQWSEGAAVVVLFSLGAALERLTMDKARNAIRSLMDLSPREATVKGSFSERRVPVDQLTLGDVVLVRPGEIVPADGTVLAGATSINQAPITGESLPVEKVVGDTVFAGTINTRGYVEVEVTRRAQDTTLAKVVHLVEEAQERRAPAQRFVDGFARRYTPAVVAGAALVALVPPLFGQPFLPWLYKALVLLVIACPCALVISTPVAIVAAIARAFRAGILVKGGAHLEAIGDVKVVAFDKTGTLTEGTPTVTDVVTLDGRSSDELLADAAAVESRSEHPLAEAILREARARGLHWPEPADFEALTGLGARATVNLARVVIGSPAFLGFAPDAAGRTPAAVQAFQRDGKTVLVVGRDDVSVGLIAVADRARAASRRAVAGLKAAGVERVVMLTGDNAITARAIASGVGVDEIRAGLLPEQKTEAVRELMGRHGSVAMVGDGVNDAPALATATVGIAMGAAGSETALETADVALMADDLERLPFLICLSRAARSTIRANVAFSLLVKAIFLALTLAGVANLWLAILADTGAALIVIAYSMRLLRFRGTEI